MGSYNRLIQLLELEKKYNNPEQQNRIRLYLEERFKYLFTKEHPGNVAFDNQIIAPQDITEGLKNTLKFFKKISLGYKALRLDEEKWVKHHLDWLLNYQSRELIEPDKKLNADYSVVEERIFEGIISDYVFLLEKVIEEHKQNTPKNKHEKGRLPKIMLLKILRLYWFNHANKPGKGTYSGKGTRFDLYIEQSFEIAKESLPSRTTINKYLGIAKP